MNECLASNLSRPRRPRGKGEGGLGGGEGGRLRRHEVSRAANWLQTEVLQERA